VGILFTLVNPGRSALAQTIEQLREAESLSIEITGYRWEEGEPEPAEVGQGTIWMKGDRVFMDLPDRKVWILGDERTQYFPQADRVVISKETEEKPAPADAFSVDQIVAYLEGLGLKKLPDETETIEGREYVRVTLVADASAREVDMCFFVDPAGRRLDYVGYRIASGPHQGRFHTWMRYIYSPTIDETAFQPTYPSDVRVRREGPRENTEDVVKRWREQALVVATDSEGMEIGLLEAWLAPDGLLGLHLYEYKVWISGSAFPDEVFPQEELTRGGLAPKDWRNTNVVLEYPRGVAHRINRGVPLPTSRHPGKGPFLREVRRFFRVPELLAEPRREECILHIWLLRQPPTPSHWREGYTETKENFAYLALRVPVQQEAAKSPSERFIAGLLPSNPRQSVEFRAWLLERNEGPAEALRLLDQQPMATQHELASRKLKLLRRLGKQREIDEFLRVHVPWRRDHDPLHERNIPRLIEEFASPGFRPEQ